MTLLNEVLEQKLHKMSGLLHVVQFCGDELESIESQIPSSHQLYLSKLSQELTRMKECLEGIKSLNIASEGYGRHKKLSDLMRLAQASFPQEHKNFHFELTKSQQGDERVDLGEEALRAVLVILKFFSLVNDKGSGVHVSLSQRELSFEMNLERHFQSFNDIWAWLESKQEHLPPDYKENLKPFLLGIISRCFNEVSLFFTSESSNPCLQLKILLSRNENEANAR